MSQRKQHREVPPEHRAQEHLANERTFLAWIRTTIALISLGFVLARAGPLLASGAKAQVMSARLSPFGIGLAAFGALMTGLAAWRYDVVNREIEKGMVKTDRALVWFIALFVMGLSIALVVYMMMSPPQNTGR
jgi:putative membrane protein